LLHQGLDASDVKLFLDVVVHLAIVPGGHAWLHDVIWDVQI